MGKSKQKVNLPKSVGLKKEANQPLIMRDYKPLPRFGSGCNHC